MNNTLTPPAPRPIQNAAVLAHVADADGHAADLAAGERPLRANFDVTPAGQLVWAAR